MGAAYSFEAWMPTHNTDSVKNWDSIIWRHLKLFVCLCVRACECACVCGACVRACVCVTNSVFIMRRSSFHENFFFSCDLVIYILLYRLLHCIWRKLKFTEGIKSRQFCDVKSSKQRNSPSNSLYKSVDEGFIIILTASADKWFIQNW
jgi:hypothetical protein